MSIAHETINRRLLNRRSRDDKLTHRYLLSLIVRELGPLPFYLLEEAPWWLLVVPLLNSLPCHELSSIRVFTAAKVANIFVQNFSIPFVTWMLLNQESNLCERDRREQYQSDEMCLRLDSQSKRHCCLGW